MTLSLQPTRRVWPKVSPEGLAARILLSFVASAGLFYVNIMAALVSGLQDGLGYTARSAGLVAAMNVYGAALGALAAVFFVARLRWKPAALGLLLGLILIDLASTQIVAPPALMALRFGHGLVGGMLVGVGFAVIARTRSPDRTFGVLLIVQFGLGGLGLLALPRLVASAGAPVLFLALAAFSLCAAIMLPFLGDYPPRPAPSRADGPAPRPAWGALIAALLAVFAFQAANMALSAFVIDLGRFYGLSLRFVTETLAAANWIGALGSALVVALGLRWGRLGPILVGAAVAGLGSLAFLRSDVAWIFVAANVVTAIVWAFVIPYLLGLCAAFDIGGRSATLAGFFSKLGLASGPALGASILQETHFPRLVLIAVAGLIACAALAWRPAQRLDQNLPT